MNNDIAFLSLCFSLVIMAAGRLGWLIRDGRARIAIARLGELHKRNVAEAYQRGINAGICSQLQVETQRANERGWN